MAKKSFFSRIMDLLQSTFSPDDIVTHFPLHNSPSSILLSDVLKEAEEKSDSAYELSKLSQLSNYQRIKTLDKSDLSDFILYLIHEK